MTDLVLLNEPLRATVICVLLLIAVAALIMIVDAAHDRPRCPATRSGGRCVHDEDHPGSHRDEYGDYWN